MAYGRSMDFKIRNVLPYSRNRIQELSGIKQLEWNNDKKRITVLEDPNHLGFTSDFNTRYLLSPYQGTRYRF